jgi:hypothetical protein
MMKNNTLATVLAVSAFMLLNAAGAQGLESPPLYAAVECMKSKSPGYPGLETDIWQPMHQELVNQGQQYSWSVYWVLYGDRSRCDYYVVTTYLGDEQLNSHDDIQQLFEEVHPGQDFTAAMAATWDARDLVATELWAGVDSTAIGEHRYAAVNKMMASDPDAYERMETQIFKPGHQALVDDGHRAGWAMYSLVTPFGSSIPYNYSTVDFSNLLSPVPMAQAMMTANPGRDLDKLQELLDLRDQVSSETWLFITGTTPPQDGR